MFRFLVICGCLLAVAQAGVIGGGLLATAPTAVALQQAGAAALPLSATVAVPTIATSTSNLIRAPVATAAVAGPTTLLAPGLATAIAAGPALTTTGIAAAPLGLNGLALNGLGAVKVL
ncbi:cuticular protein CPF2 isoform X2 [Xylocopa sonorina]|uniref:cuticular protein CPF2 isoform X2 n=1 Tax=Xylocopa sonorina TaxID=1818115 RepID=UPI00403AAED8